jgi:hypothetical protein
VARKITLSEIKMQLKTIKKLLREGKLEEAEREFMYSLYSTEGLKLWKEALLIKNPEDKIPHLLGFATKIVFCEKITTASVNFHTKVIKLGSTFFCDYISSWGDVIFILMHERNHLLIDYFYTSRMNEFKNRIFANMWEDIYINNTILEHVDSQLCQRFYANPDANNLDWLMSQSKIYEWFSWFNKEHARVVVACPTFFEFAEQLSEGLLDPKNVGYYSWMEIGLAVELEITTERYLDIGGLPENNGESGGSLPELEEGSSSSEDSTEDLVLEERDKELTIDSYPVTKTRVGPQSLPEHIKELLALKLSSDEYIYRNTDRQATYKEVISRQVVQPLLASRIIDDEYKVLSPFPSSISRRDIFSLACGLVPTYWEQNRHKPVEEKAISLYIDTSGSMQEWYPMIPQIVKELNGFCSLVYNFDTHVIQVEDPLSSVIYNTTQGTNYNKVCKHITENEINSIIVFSDSTESIQKSYIKSLGLRLKQFIYITTSKKDGKSCGFIELAKEMGDKKAKVVYLGNVTATKKEFS